LFVGVKLAERLPACNEWAQETATFPIPVTLDDFAARLGYILIFGSGFTDIS
jgi:hypothetical protein